MAHAWHDWPSTPARHRVAAPPPAPDRVGAFYPAFRFGAGEGNRTLMTSLEDRWCRNRLIRPDVAASTWASSARE
jgi:hypothetical protein